MSFSRCSAVLNSFAAYLKGDNQWSMQALDAKTPSTIPHRLDAREAELNKRGSIRQRQVSFHRSSGNDSDHIDQVIFQYSKIGTPAVPLGSPSSLLRWISCFHPIQALQ